ncbi:MAG: hypothetical protein SFU21_06105 [Flavihumibacter sp.]|nr:hypothetical protein [Flavihumibacter sp.]
MQTHHCYFCNYTGIPVHVHGHYQCAVCHTNILPCCDGDNCDTNQLLVTTNNTAAVKNTATLGKKKVD